MRPNNKKKAKSEEKRERERVGRRRREDELEMDGSGAAAGNHSGNALRYGKRSVLHSQIRAWQTPMFGLMAGELQTLEIKLTLVSCLVTPKSCFANDIVKKINCSPGFTTVF
ncbi:hypothetical protein JHK87_026272 [Glycine soja]|nr:hypothetical protein JHK87_026272 [Glycine soja]